MAAGKTSNNKTMGLIAGVIVIIVVLVIGLSLIHTSGKQSVISTTSTVTPVTSTSQSTISQSTTYTTIQQSTIPQQQKFDSYTNPNLSSWKMSYPAGWSVNSVTVSGGYGVIFASPGNSERISAEAVLLDSGTTLNQLYQAYKNSTKNETGYIINVGTPTVEMLGNNTGKYCISTGSCNNWLLFNTTIKSIALNYTTYYEEQAFYVYGNSTESLVISALLSTNNTTAFGYYSNVFKQVVNSINTG